MRRFMPLLIAAIAAASAGCSSDARPAGPPTARDAAPLLATAPTAAGEIIVRGDVSPATHGPFTFAGEYRVRFEQYAPEDPSLDFAAQTAFVADLQTRPAGRDGERRGLFRSARRRGARRMRVSGRWFVDVSFGDFPYVIRFTPVR